jgi:membrane-bound lytic murein transglycosylase D
VKNTGTQSNSVSSSVKTIDYEGKKIYKVRSGDTLWDISKSTNIPIHEIKKLNNLSGNTIKPGQQLIIGSD